MGNSSHADDGTGWCVACGCAYPCPGSDPVGKQRRESEWRKDRRGKKEKKK